jgi:HK97 family phage prohead protease
MIHERLGGSDQLLHDGLAARTRLGVVECRAATIDVRQIGSATFALHGYAAVWDTGYDIAGGAAAGGFTETIAPSAVTKSLRESDDVRFLINHDGVPLARTKAGTMTLVADDIGLYVDVPAIDLGNPRAQELRSALERGDIDQMSWAFYVTRQEWSADYTQRRIIEARMVDVSAVTFPANDATVIGIRESDSSVTVSDRGGMPLSLAIAQAALIDN